MTRHDKVDDILDELADIHGLRKEEVQIMVVIMGLDLKRIRKNIKRQNINTFDHLVFKKEQ